MRKKLLSLLLAALMILGLLPAAALAAEGDTPPTLAEGVEESVKKYGFEGIAWELDLSTIFTDADGDPLTYKVSVNGADPVEAAEKYSYVCGAANATLKFTANDGKADSDKTYTVTLNVEPKTKLLLESGSSEVSVGTPFTLAMSTIFENGYGVTVYVSINGADKEFVNSGSVKKVTFSRAFANPGVYTLEFYEKHGPTFVGPYTHTLTVTGEAIENRAPVVQNPTEGPGQLGSGVNRTQWKPDLASIFSDPDGDTLTYSRSIDGSVFSEYYPTVGIHADYLTSDGIHTVTIRATDPYGEYAEFTVTIEKLTNHRPTKKADAPDKLSVFVPVGVTYTVDANLYYEDVDAKDQGKLRFLNNRYQSAGSYTASTVGDTKTETAYCNDTSNESAFSGIEITYTAIGIDDENAAITNGETYSRNLAELNFPGNYKVRINGGAEQDAAESYTFTPSKPGKYYLHFYGSQTKTSEQNYVVKLTVQPNGTEPAPMTVSIGEKNYDVKLTALVGSKSWFGGPDDVPFYLTAVPADFKTLTLTVDKQDNTVKEVVCGEFEPVEGSGAVYTVKNHTCFTGDLDVNVSDVIDTSKYGVIPVLIQDTTEQYTGLLIQVGEPKPNTPPTLAEGVETSVKSYGYEDIAWELDLSTIFHDADGDALTYKVSVNGADPVEAAEKYSYVCGAANATLKFTANDGKADSDKTYTVTLNVEPKTKLLLESGSSEVSVGTPFTLAMSTIFENGYGVTVYVSINGADKEFVNSGNVKSVTFSRAFANPGVYTLEFYEKHGPTFVGPYTHTLTVTGKAIENHAPVVQNPTEGPGQLGSGVNVTYWKPDLASIFSDPDGDTLTYSYSIDGARFSDYYTSVGIHADYLKPDGTHTVTIRATDPYGEYADLTVTIEKLTNHTPTKKADAPSSLSVFVPVGITYEVDANLYYEDVDAKDQGNLRFKSNRYGSAGKYTASAVGDTKTETAYGNDTSNSNAASGIKITYTAIAIDTEGTLTTGETYTVDPAALDGINIPGSYKVRVTNGTKGSVEQSFDGTFSFIPKTPGTYVVHIYGDKSSTAEENYVVKLTVTGDYLEWPTIEKFELSTVTGAAVDGEDGDQTLTVKDIQIEQYEKLKDNQYGDSKVAGCITITLDDSFVTKGRSWIQIPGKTAAITASEGATPGSAVNRNKKFYQTGDYMLETAYYVATNDLSVAYTVKFIQSAPITFAPVIGNGTAAGTTENNVTTFPAGSGTGAPTVTVTAPASGWAAGENTFTVACDKACVVLVKSGETYTKLAAANSGETHSFTANLAEGDEIIVRLKGDVNGHGIVNALDATLVSRACLSETHGAYKALDALSICAVGTPSALVAMQINRACLSTTHGAYQAMTW